jgi:hypothetical protein
MWKFEKACELNDLETAKQLYEKDLTATVREINLHINHELPLRIACKNGAIDVVKWLINETDGKTDIHIRLDEPFRLSCRYGYKELSEFLLSVDGKTNTHFVDDDAFRAACGGGHLEIVKWLWDKGGINLNDNIIHGAFIRSCINGHKHVAEWLWSHDEFKDSIRDAFDLSFEFACRGNHLETAKYILTICDLSTLEVCTYQQQIYDTLVATL